MSHYKIIADEKELDKFLAILPPTSPTEVYYLTLFSRKKYSLIVKDDAQIVRFLSKHEDIKEKILRLEGPLGCYKREYGDVPQESLALYISPNPKCLQKANKSLLVELAKRLSEGNLNFNPASLAITETHKATGNKYFVDFDYDAVNVADYTQYFQNLLPVDSYIIIKTRGGFHVLVELSKVKNLKFWYKGMTCLAAYDNNTDMMPVPGCSQGDYIPFVWEPGKF